MDGFDLSRNTVLRLAPELRLILRPAGVIEIEAPSGSLQFQPPALAVLEMFSEPLTLGEALDRFRPHCPTPVAWMAATQRIVDLLRSGVLCTQDPGTASLAAHLEGFSNAATHTALLNDEQRTLAFLAAIRRTVRPGDVVVDLGTGTGVLAVAAAKAGARHVYAIEATPIARVCEELARANGVSDRVTVVRGWSPHLSLPERAHVLVSEILGNDPLGEQVLESTKDAVRRFLLPQARLIPSDLCIDATWVTIPETELEQRYFTPSNTQRWSDLYGLRFDALQALSPPSSHRFLVLPERARAWPQLGSCELSRVDLAQITSPVVNAQVAARPKCAGLLNGILISFRAQLVEGTSLATNPSEASEHCNWKLYAYPVPPIAVQLDSQILVKYSYRAGVTRVAVEALE